MWTFKILIFEKCNFSILRKYHWDVMPWWDTKYTIGKVIPHVGIGLCGESKWTHEEFIMNQWPLYLFVQLKWLRNKCEMSFCLVNPKAFNPQFQLQGDKEHAPSLQIFNLKNIYHWLLKTIMTKKHPNMHKNKDKW